MKYRLFLSLLLTIPFSAIAQETGHTLYINAGGGIHSLSYPLDNGNRKGNFGYTVNAGYGYFFAPRWGVTTGLGIKSIQSNATLNFMTGTPATDTDGDTYEYRTYFNQWKEKQKATLIDIPLGLQYRHPIGKIHLLATAGLLVSIPVQKSYSVTSGSITTTGYYSQWNVELSDMPQHGFTTVTNCPSGDVSLKTAYSIFADMGVEYPLSETFALYAGGYFSYGLNNVIKSQNQSLYQEDGTYNGILSSSQTDRARPVTIGLKVGIVLHLKHKKPEVIETTESTPLETVVAKVIVPSEVVPPAEVAVKEEITQPKQEVAIVPTAAEKETLHKDSIYKEVKKIAQATNITFELNSDSILNQEREKIQALSKMLKDNPDITLYITGHTCNIGTHEINMEIGMKRALHVKQIFMNQGVPNQQIKTDSKAYDEPLVPNTSDENRAKNRRVELNLSDTK